jgi:hypothetical protein
VVENTRRKKEREIKLRYRYTGGAICDLNPNTVMIEMTVQKEVGIFLNFIRPGSHQMCRDHIMNNS